MNISESIETCFQKFTQFKGRASRSEYWWFVLGVVAVSLIGDIMVWLVSLENYEQGFMVGVAKHVVMLVLAVAQFAAGARRLHDVGRSGWWQLLSITLIGLIPLCLWMSADGGRTTNRYGEPVSEANP